MTKPPSILGGDHNPFKDQDLPNYDEEQYEGSVKWFNSDKGYGFIACGQLNKDVFAHYSEINLDGYKTLSEGQIVLFGIEHTDKGIKATNITLK